MFSKLRPLIFKVDPEKAHTLAIKSLKFNLIPNVFDENKNDPIFQTKIFNTDLDNPIGIAAGFDKNAEVYNPLFKLGFGFVEVGTITPLKQYGNPKPRVFRLVEDEALINRLGFNNHGSKVIIDRIKSNNKLGILGINVGPNKDSDDRMNDYLVGLRTFHKVADYITINISCPNTEEGKTFEDPETLNDLLYQINLVRKTDKPLFVKFSSDADYVVLKELTDICLNHRVDGFICSNTSSNRINLKTELHELTTIGKGGLSGKPVKKASLKNVELVRSFAPNSVVIGVGGISSGEDAIDYLKAGADLIQVYTGLIYEGPSLVKRIQTKLIEYFN